MLVGDKPLGHGSHSLIYYPNISRNMEVMAPTSITPKTNGDNYKRKKPEVSLLHTTPLINLTFTPTKYYQKFANGTGVRDCTNFCFPYV